AARLARAHPTHAFSPAAANPVEVQQCLVFLTGTLTIRRTTIAVMLFATSANADDLLDLLAKPALGIAPLASALNAIGPALSEAVASTYPVPSASSSVAFAWDPTKDTFVQATTIGSPIIGERAETIGHRRLNVTLSHSYVDLDTLNGNDLDSLENRPSVDG